MNNDTSSIINPLDIIASIEKYKDDNAELARLYLGMCETADVIEEIKKSILKRVEANLFNANIDWDQSQIATYGMTDPKPISRLDKQAWETAVFENPELSKLEVEYYKAQMPFMVNATQPSRPFVRRKRGSYNE